MMVENQHDDWLNGGSEFDIQVGYPTGNGYVGGITKVRHTFSRNQIKKKMWFTFNDYLNTNWREDQITNAFQIYETDGGGTNYWDANLSASIGKFGTYGLTVKIPHGSRDDLIYQLVIDRTFMLHNSSEKFNSRGVNWYMPIETITY